MNNTDSSVNIQQMNHLRENKGSCLADAWSLVEDSDKRGWGDASTERKHNENLALPN